jgi:hypothetical protein
VPMSWPDHVDDVIGGDLTAALAYATPAGGAVVVAVAPIGLRDREAGTVSFTTSLGLGKKLERIRQEPRVALAYHAREHGSSERPEYVLVQGRAEAVMEPSREYVDLMGRQAEQFLGPRKQGRFWDAWLREYYRLRIPVDVQVDRITVWPDTDCRGGAEAMGSPPPPAGPEPQRAPRKGTGPRLDAARAANQVGRLPHLLLGYVDSDGYPRVVPVRLRHSGANGLELEGRLPPGARRAGLMGHDYKRQLVGLRARQYTGWLEADGESGLYAPHTEQSFAAPSNKTLLLLANGLLAKRGVRRARREGKLPAGAV